MMSDIKVEYLDAVIQYSEFTNTWEIEGNFPNKFESLAKAKKYVDLKKNVYSRIKPFTAFIAKGWRQDNGFRRVKITSVLPDGSVWVNHEGKLEKHRGTIFRDTPENEKNIAEIKMLEEKIDGLTGDRDHLFDSLEKIDIDGLIAKEGDNAVETN